MPISKKKKQIASEPVPENETAPESAKLEDFEQSFPLQLSLFEFLPEEKSYSNTIELYDFMPKYVWGKVERINGKFLESLERVFECRGVKYVIEVAPAVIKDRDGVKRYYYPSKREELVEDALRRIVTAKQGLFLDEQASVTFTLYQLQQELKTNGHSYSLSQLKDALLICNRTNITVTSEDGKTVLSSNMFETLGLQTREDWQGTGAKTKAFVRFNSLVTAGIKRGAFRQLDYETTMKYSNIIARQLHKRMSHHYTQASITSPYTILLSTIIRDFGLTPYQWLSQNLRDVETALKEMEQKQVVLSYTVKKTLDPTSRNKLIEAKFNIIPHPRFVQESKKANYRAAKIETTLGQKSLPSDGK